MIKAVRTSIKNCGYDEWFSWVFQCIDKKYVCLGRYWIFSEKNGTAKFYPKTKQNR